MERPLSAATKATSARISRRGWGIIIFLFVLGAINFADKGAATVLAVPMIQAFHLTATQWGIYSGGFFWLFSLSSIVVGSLSDIIGYQRILPVLALVWSVVQVATAFVINFPLLLLTRIGLGVGEGPYTGIAVAEAARWLPPERRGLGLAIVTSGNLIGLTLMTPVLIFMSVTFGWRSAFLLLGGLSLLWLLLFIPFSKRAAGVKRENRVLPATEKKVSWPQVLPLLLSRNMILLTLAAFSAYWFQSMMLSWIAVFLTSVHHVALKDLAFVSPVIPLLACVMQFFFSGLADLLFRRTGKSQSYVSVLGWVLVLTAILITAGAFSSSTIWAVVLMGLAPNGAAYALTGTLIVGITPKDQRGTVQGITIALATLAGILGPTITGPIIQAAGQNITAGFHTVYLLTGAIALVSALATFIFIRVDFTKETTPV